MKGFIAPLKNQINKGLLYDWYIPTDLLCQAQLKNTNINLWDVYQCTPTTRIGNLDFNMKRETKKFNYDCQAQSKLKLGWVGLLYSQLIHHVSGSTSKLGKQAWAAELTRYYWCPYPGHPSLFGIKWEYSDCHLCSVFKLDWTLRVESFTDRFAVPTPKKA